MTNQKEAPDRGLFAAGFFVEYKRLALYLKV